MLLYYPIDDKSLMLANMYACYTVGEHTHTHKGWDENLAKQFERVCNGQIAQNYVANLLRLNSVEVLEDETPHTKPDAFDFKVGKYLFDVKSSAHPLMPMQVSLATARKKPDCFVFCRLDVKKLAICILGYVKASDVLQERYFVPKGEVIPNTDIVQVFEEGSYFYTGEFKPLQSIVEWAKGTK